MKWLFLAKPLGVVILLILAFTCSARLAFADSPPNLTTDIEWDENSNTAGDQQTYSGVAAIEAAFNNARRQEEQQLGLTNGALGNLSLPAQADWNTYTNNQKGLFITNAERVARNGVQTNVIGKPLSGIENSLRTIAQTYAQLLVDNNTSGHNANGSPFDRLDAVFGDPITNPSTACREFMARGENIASFWSFGGTSIPLPIERAIYGWIYADAGSSWGHREAALLQDITLDNNPWGYHDNVGANGNEGYIGFGYVSDPSYDPFSFGGVTAAAVVVMNIIDPSPNVGCTYNVLPAAPVKINASVSQSVAAAYNATALACPSTGGNLPIHTITATLHNTSGTTFANLFFKVKTLEYVAGQGGQVPSLCNATTPVANGGVGSLLSVPNNSLPGNDSAYNPNDDLVRVFTVGLPVRASYRFLVDLYYNTVNAAAIGGQPAGDYLGTLVYEFDENGQLVGSNNAIFLPLIAAGRR